MEMPGFNHFLFSGRGGGCLSLCQDGYRRALKNKKEGGLGGVALPSSLSGLEAIFY
jgi:hypothetical protein